MAKKKDQEAFNNVELEGADNTRVYELGMHFSPDLPTEEVKKAYQSIHTNVESRGTIFAEVEPHLIKLAYTVSRQETSGRRDFSSAYFSWIVYETSATRHAEVIADAGKESRIIRFIDLITTKEAARHAAELFELSLKNQREHTANAGEVESDETDVELDEALKSVEA